MKLSIFPSVLNLPQNKQEKSESAKKAIQPEVVEVEDDETLLRLVQDYAWSPYVFNGTRKQDNFKSSDWAVLDMDAGLTIEEAERIIAEANFTCLCLPTTSHQPDNHRFRLILPLSKTITDKATMIATMEDLYEAFPQADRSCITDIARFYYSGKMVDGFWIEGDLLEPVEPPKTALNSPTRRLDVSAKVRTSEDIKELIKDLYGEDREHISECVDYFIKGASSGLSGNWTMSLNNAVLVLAYQGIDYDTIYDLIEYLAPNPLDKRDIVTIKKAFEDGRSEYEERTDD